VIYEPKKGRKKQKMWNHFAELHSLNLKNLSFSSVLIVTRQCITLKAYTFVQSVFTSAEVEQVQDGAKKQRLIRKV